MLTKAQERAVIGHMNADHDDAVLLYARVFGHQMNATRAWLTGLDVAHMRLNVETEADTHEMTVALTDPVTDPTSARTVLVAMVGEARRRLAAARPSGA